MSQQGGGGVPSISEQRRWSPKHATVLTLRQLGIPQGVIDASCAQYLSAEEPLPPSDAAFMRRVIAEWKTNESVSANVAALHAIPISWAPSRRLTEELLAEGYWEELLRNCVDLFIVSTRERSLRHISYDAAFAHYVRKRWPITISSVQWQEWSPGPASVAYLTGIGYSRKEIRDHCEIFRQLAPSKSIPATQRESEFTKFCKRWAR